MIKKVFLIIFLTTIFLSGCSTSNQNENVKGEIETIRLPMGYIPNIQYAPFYMAAEKGYFAEAGFEVEFDYSFETDGVSLVAAGELPFAVVSGEQVLLARAQQLPVVYVAAWFQNFPVAVITSVESGITQPSQLAGQQIALPGLFGANYVGLSALLQYAGIGAEDVVLNAIGFNQVEIFSTGIEQIVVGYISNEPIQIENLGLSVNVIAIKDYIELAANGLITNEEYMANEPQKAEKFVHAFLKGLADVIENPEEGYQVSMQFVEGLSDDNKELQMEILETTIEYWKADRLGEINPQAWENMHSVLLEMGFLVSPIEYEDAYSNQFVP